MAENIQKRLEATTIELEEMKRLDLFTPEECRMVKTRREMYENRIGGFKKCLNDFKRYIDYEYCLYKLIRLRRNKLKVSEKSGNLDHKILQRIRALYKLAIQRFPKDLDLYLEFYKLCKKTKFAKRNNEICQMMIKNHMDDENVWLLASHWYVSDRKEYTYAIKFLRKGIAKRPDFKLLYIQCMKYEVMKANAVIKASDEPEELQKKLVASLLLYCKAMFAAKIDDINVYKDFLIWLEKDEFCSPVQDAIVDYLKKLYSDNV